MATELNVLPVSIVAGETLSAAISGVTGSGTLTYSFAGKTIVSQAAQLDGVAFTLTLSPAQTISLGPGRIRFVAMQVISEVSSCVDSGFLFIESSPLLTSDYTAALAAVEAAILNYATSTNRSISIGGVSVTYRDLNELLKLRQFYRDEIMADTTGAGETPVRVSSRFFF